MLNTPPHAHTAAASTNAKTKNKHDENHLDNKVNSNIGLGGRRGPAGRAIEDTQGGWPRGASYHGKYQGSDTCKLLLSLLHRLLVFFFFTNFRSNLLHFVNVEIPSYLNFG